MTSNLSKFTIAGAVAIVILMMVSAIPSDAATDYAEKQDKKDDSIVVFAGESDSGDKWTWDGTVLTLKDGLEVHNIYIGENLISNGFTTPPKIVVEGNVLFKNVKNEAGQILIKTPIGGSIVGNGKLTGDDVKIIFGEGPGITNSIVPTYTIDGISIDFDRRSSDFSIFSNGNLVIKNCPCVKIDRNGLDANAPNALIWANDILEIGNTNLYLSTTVGGRLLEAYDGIIMPMSPSGSNNFMFSKDLEPMEEFVSGETTLISIYDAGYLTMESYESKNFTPIIIGIFVVVLVLVAFGTYAIYRKR